MKILIVYDTYYGNTQKVAEFIKDQINEDSVDLIKIDVITQNQIDAADLVIIGGPTRAFNMTKKVRKAIKKYNFKNKKFWAFDTRSKLEDVDSKFLLNMVKRFGYAAEKIEKKIIRKGGIKVMDYGFYFVKDIEGPLYEQVNDDIERDIKGLV